MDYPIYHVRGLSWGEIKIILEWTNLNPSICGCAYRHYGLVLTPTWFVTSVWYLFMDRQIGPYSTTPGQKPDTGSKITLNKMKTKPHTVTHEFEKKKQRKARTIILVFELEWISEINVLTISFLLYL